jgi:hypothetical protein
MAEVLLFHRAQGQTEGLHAFAGMAYAQEIGLRTR